MPSVYLGFKATQIRWSAGRQDALTEAALILRQIAKPQCGLLDHRACQIEWQEVICDVPGRRVFLNDQGSFSSPRLQLVGAISADTAVTALATEIAEKAWAKIQVQIGAPARAQFVFTQARTDGNEELRLIGWIAAFDGDLNRSTQIPEIWTTKWARRTSER